MFFIQNSKKYILTRLFFEACSDVSSSKYLFCLIFYLLGNGLSFFIFNMFVAYCSEEFCLGDEPQTNKSCHLLLRNCMMCNQRRSQKLRKKKYSQQIVESSSHRALFFVCY